MLRTPPCDMLGISTPILRAAMGVYRGLVTTPALVAAVCNAGGLGCVGGVGLIEGDLRAGEVALVKHRLHAGKAAEHADLDAAGRDAGDVVRGCRSAAAEQCDSGAAGRKLPALELEALLLWLWRGARRFNR